MAILALNSLCFFFRSLFYNRLVIKATLDCSRAFSWTQNHFILLLFSLRVNFSMTLEVALRCSSHTKPFA